VEHIVGVSVIAIIAASGVSVISLTVRCLFRFLDHRGERQLLLQVLDKTGSTSEFGSYTELRRTERPFVIVDRQQVRGELGTSSPELPAP
jgi:hypothetical protein